MMVRMNPITTYASMLDIIDEQIEQLAMMDEPEGCEMIVSVELANVLSRARVLLQALCADHEPLTKGQ
jgi:hypothetical protein